MKDLVSPIFLKVPQSPKITPPIGSKQALLHKTVEGILDSNRNKREVRCKSDWPGGSAGQGSCCQDPRGGRRDLALANCLGSSRECAHDLIRAK